MAWIYLGAAILLEVAGITSMKLSRGFSEPLPSIAVADNADPEREPPRSTKATMARLPLGIYTHSRNYASFSTLVHPSSSPGTVTYQVDVMDV